MSNMIRAALALALVGTSRAGVQMSIRYPRESQQSDGASVASSGGFNFQPFGSTLGDGGTVWRDTKDARFVEVPAWMVEMDLMIGSHRSPTDTKFGWICQKLGAQTGPQCILYIFQYRCPGCAIEDGNLAQVLADHDKDWVLGYCAPKFKILGTDLEVHHPMIAYRTTATAGESVEVTTTAVTGYVIMGGEDRDQFSDPCADFMNMGACEAMANKGRCEWTGSACVYRSCKKVFTGPSISLPGAPSLNVCSRCIAEDLPPGHDPSPQMQVDMMSPP